MAAQTAKDVMTTIVHAVRPYQTLREAAELMAEHHISGLPVVDADGKVVGMVTEADLIDEHKREAAIPRTALYGLFAIPDETVIAAFQGGMKLQVQQVMSKSVTTATEETTLHEVADLMVRRRINRIPIVRGGMLVGIVSRGDIVRALAAAGGESATRGE
jgi:CBS domain-containing protein